MIARHRAHQSSQQTMNASRHPHYVPLVCKRHVRQSSVTRNPSGESLEILHQLFPHGTPCLRVSCGLAPPRYRRQAGWSLWANICMFIQLSSEHACIDKTKMKIHKTSKMKRSYLTPRPIPLPLAVGGLDPP